MMTSQDDPISTSMDLEREVLALHEADPAGIEEGMFVFARVQMSSDAVAAINGHTKASARRFLKGEVTMAKRYGGAEHWAGMLKGEMPDAELPPVIHFDTEQQAPEIVDGVHRLAAHTALDTGTEIIAAIRKDADSDTLTTLWPDIAEAFRFHFELQSGPSL